VSFADAGRRVGLMFGGVALLLVVVTAIQVPMRALHVPDAVAAVALVVVTLAIYFWYRRLTERRRPDDLAPRYLARDVLCGFALGLILFAVVIGLLAAVGGYRGVYAGTPVALIPAALLLAAGAAIEEVLFRGFLFRTVQDVCGTWIAVAVSAVLFGALHAGNPGATFFSSAAIALEAGVLLALAYAATQRLWLPIGIHLGWNFCEGNVFGTSVSGTAIRPTSIFHGTLVGHPVLTGGSFGPEASVFAVAVCLVAAGCLGVYAFRARHIVPRPRVAATR
jgi:membrane protease YdiL (CAAX protease family)